MSQDALGQLKHLKTARARWPFPDAYVMLGVYLEYLIGIWMGSGTFFKCTREVCTSGLKERI